MTTPDIELVRAFIDGQEKWSSEMIWPKSSFCGKTALEAFERIVAERDEALAQIDEAQTAASETQSSWKHRCHAILSALGFDYGDPDFEMPDEISRREKAEAERDALKEALKPFGLLAEAIAEADPECDRDDFNLFSIPDVSLSLGPFRAARSALKGGTE